MWRKCYYKIPIYPMKYSQWILCDVGRMWQLFKLHETHSKHAMHPFSSIILFLKKKNPLSTRVLKVGRLMSHVFSRTSELEYSTDEGLACLCVCECGCVCSCVGTWKRSCACYKKYCDDKPSPLPLPTRPAPCMQQATHLGVHCFSALVWNTESPPEMCSLRFPSLEFCYHLNTHTQRRRISVYSLKPNKSEPKVCCT